MFKKYRDGFRQAIKEHGDEWNRFKWYEKAGVCICGPIAYVFGYVSGMVEGLAEAQKEKRKRK